MSKRVRNGVYSVGPDPEELNNVLLVVGSEVVNGGWEINWVEREGEADEGIACPKVYPDTRLKITRVCDVPAGRAHQGNYNDVIEQVRRERGKAL